MKEQNTANGIANASNDDLRTLAANILEYRIVAGPGLPTRRPETLA